MQILPIYVVMLLLGAMPVLAQQPDLVLPEAKTLARFAEARAMAMDPQGRLYVADAGADVVYQLTQEGMWLAKIGGAGAQEGAFFEPSDIDPTNGLSLVVADAGNGRIQRFSNRFVPLESLSVGRENAGTRRSSEQAFYQFGEESPREAGGEPVGVVTSVTNELFVLDAAQRVVLKWDVRRKLERTIGGYDAGEGALQNPVALALDATSLYVADRERGAVLVYDHFGDYIRAMGQGQLANLRAVVVDDNRIWAVGEKGLWVFEKPGRLQWRSTMSLGEPLVDVLPSANGLFLLTPTRLLFAEGFTGRL